MKPDLRTIRQRTEPWKSFPDAVAALIADSCRRGASRVSVQFGDNGALYVMDDGIAVSDDELRGLLDRLETVAPLFGFVHHAGYVHVKTMTTSVQLSSALEIPEFGPVGFNVCAPGTTHMVAWMRLGEGDGVNARQDRTAARLVRRLPTLLAPSHAAKVTILDEAGNRHVLPVAETMTEMVDGYELTYPATLTSVPLMGQGGELRLAYNGGVVTMFEFATERLPLLKFGLVHLRSPWLRGVIEVREPVGVRALGDAFADEQLARALTRATINARVGEQAQAVAREVCFDALGRKHTFAYCGRTWQVGVFPQPMPGQRGPAWIDIEFDRRALVTPIDIDPLDPLYQADSDWDAIVERVRFAIAECLHERLGLRVPVTNVYIGLRTAIEFPRA